MEVTTVVIRCLLVVSLAATARACIPEMGAFRFGGCPNMTASADQDISQAEGRWYVLQTTSSRRPATCVRIDIQETFTNSSLFELLYRYTRGSADHIKALHVRQQLETPSIVVQNTGPVGLFGPRRLVVQLFQSGQLAAAVSCQPLLIGHVIYGQLWSRNTTVEPEQLIPVTRALAERGVTDRVLRQVTQDGCPGYSE